MAQSANRRSATAPVCAVEIRLAPLRVANPDSPCIDVMIARWTTFYRPHTGFHGLSRSVVQPSCSKATRHGTLATLSSKTVVKPSSECAS